jgi:hypothetical protein
VVGGFSTGMSTSWDATTVGFNPQNGARLWTQQWDDGWGLADEIGSLAAGPGGDLYAVGYGYGPETDSDLLTLHYLLDYAAGVKEAGSTPTELRLAPPRPNPARAGTFIDFGLGQESPVRLVIFDAAGRIVRTLTGGALPPGRHAWEWDGKDESLRTVPSGRYFVNLSAGGVSRTAGVVIMH